MEGGPINSYTEDDFTTPLVARGTTISTTAQKLYLIIYYLFVYLFYLFMLCCADGFEEQRRQRYIVIARRTVALICAMIIGLQSGTTVLLPHTPHTHRTQHTTHAPHTPRTHRTHTAHNTPHTHTAHNTQHTHRTHTAHNTQHTHRTHHTHTAHNTQHTHRTHTPHTTHNTRTAHTTHTAHTPHTPLTIFKWDTQNAFNTISSHIQNDTGLGDNLMTLLSSLGIIGLFFTFPAGYVNDRFGAMWTGLIGAVLTSAGYAGMSFTDKESYAAMLICLMLVGFGSGTTFLAALSTGLKTIPGYPGIPIIKAFFYIFIFIFCFPDLSNIYLFNAFC